MKGFVHIGLTFILILIAALFFSTTRQYIYLTYQNLGNLAGLNFNNIARESYVQFIKSQSNRPENANSAIFLNKQFPINSNLAKVEKVLGETTRDDTKWIETDLSEQRLYMMENGKVVNSFLVSTGKWAPTPKGEWRIWTKLTSTTMKGGSKALGTYYYLPNVPYTMYYDRGYGIHGAYWHNNFGNTMSHGCTNMKPEEAKIVFDWASVGTKVIVHD